MASVVMSFPKLRLLFKPVLVSYDHIYASSEHWVTFTTCSPLFIAFTNKAMNQSSVGAFPEPYVSSTIPFKPGIPKNSRQHGFTDPWKHFDYHIIV
jgi:hypothetical protein